MGCNINYKCVDDRYKAVVEYLKVRYSPEQLMALTASLMGWDFSSIRYESASSMLEILKDFILGKESAFEAMLNKDIDDMPLYVNHGTPISKAVSVWRLLCGK